MGRRKQEKDTLEQMLDKGRDVPAISATVVPFLPYSQRTTCQLIIVYALNLMFVEMIYALNLKFVKVIGGERRRKTKVAATSNRQSTWRSMPVISRNGRHAYTPPQVDHVATKISKLRVEGTRSKNLGSREKEGRWDSHQS